ncbi:MAG: hypothetical protein QHC67_01165 [Sphingobium sp.]|uniref:hypothetical protein n=1 Tax=Sphingobium sp. TaxID=1912891 RepID=UPI0029AEAC13|nr:hypothetical protein [Sphingobium sp.]MDX3908417.1 hypothetical protein [Sphingobium sp.]
MSNRPARARAPSAAPAHPAVTPAEAPLAQQPAPSAPVDGPKYAPEKAMQGCAWLLMKTGLTGPEICLSNGDKHLFDATPGPEGEPSEAQRLVDAGFAEYCDAPEA